MTGTERTSVAEESEGTEESGFPDFRDHARADKAIAPVPRRRRQIIETSDEGASEDDGDTGGTPDWRAWEGPRSRRLAGRPVPRSEQYRQYRTVRRCSLAASVAGFLGAVSTIVANILGLGLTLPSLYIATLIVSAALVLVAPVCLTAIEITTRRSRAATEAERRAAEADSRIARLEARVDALSRHLGPD